MNHLFCFKNLAESSRKLMSWCLAKGSCLTMAVGYPQESAENGSVSFVGTC